MHTHKMKEHPVTWVACPVSEEADVCFKSDEIPWNPLLLSDYSVCFGKTGGKHSHWQPWFTVAFHEDSARGIQQEDSIASSYQNGFSLTCNVRPIIYLSVSSGTLCKSLWGSEADLFPWVISAEAPTHRELTFLSKPRNAGGRWGCWKRGQILH